MRELKAAHLVSSSDLARLGDRIRLAKDEEGPEYGVVTTIRAGLVDFNGLKILTWEKSVIDDNSRILVRIADGPADHVLLPANATSLLASAELPPSRA